MTGEALFRVIYTSRNRVGADAALLTAAVADILAVARRANARAGVTGALLYSPAGFAQVLEGSLPDVTATFERIQRDPRHGDIQVLDSGPIGARGFAGWSMAAAPPASARVRRLDLGTAPAGEVLGLLASLIGPEPAPPRGTDLPALPETAMTRRPRARRRPEEIPA
ncbi:MAG: BLUF domain-containing protein [Rhodospirillales bacterium]|nr:BLUF domain-containing protein [Rhodospirillales bacterium]